MAVSKTRRTRIFGAAAAFVGVGAAGLIMAAPANAAVTGLSWDGPSGYGSSEGARGTSCLYGVTAKATNGAGDVEFVVTKEGVTDPVAEKKVEVENGEAAYTFKPTTTGSYTITATQLTNPVSAPYTLKTEVKQGINLDVGPDTGSLTIVSPLQAACLVIG